MQMMSMPDASGIRSFWTRQALCRKSSSQESAGVSSMMSMDDEQVYIRIVAVVSAGPGTKQECWVSFA